ncbi:DUF1501 domain-containing protein [Parasphingorhabdus cellanae]|uniref:DUF1501 domain-containing protein n=1 Tax=Parasphingorhabdus cellanae TaxID=2806553 RepID=A0ABX7T6L6_9SPHN|nr:DUF1501 domain-containing protein [Parasphingorhabdus cellanae]QTD56771.1 DUF1501 domain-containing protein [Parasphingorhabdus cellanae]
MQYHRRSVIAAGLSGLAMSVAYPGMAWASAATDKRFVFILQRGAADGLATIAPTGDPDYLPARGDLAQEALTGNKLDSFFTLHPAMVESAKLYREKQARFLHALASGYRERSHFDAQNVMESGAMQPYGRDDGWMNRLLSLLPAESAKAMAIAPAVPLILRGPVPASSYEKSRAKGPDGDLMQRVAMLYAEDPALSSLWQDALAADAMANMQQGQMRGGAAIGSMAAGLMSGLAGARVLMLETNGWDTHSRQKGRLGNQLKQADALIAALRDGLGENWNNTLVLVATEFGRTVAFNGTGGTDHGTGSAAMLFGGALKNGGTVQADWPGLAPANLLDNRDLRPTMRFEAMVTGALSDHYGIEPGQMKKTLFPDFV